MSSPTADDIARLEAEVVSAQQRLEVAKKRRIELCEHPFEQLSFTAGACASHSRGYIDRDIWVRCSCGMAATIGVRFHED